MTTLRAGVATYEEIVTISTTARRPEPWVKKAGQNVVWFTSIQEFATLLSSRHLELLTVIDEEAPNSLEQLAQILGWSRSAALRASRIMESYGLIRIERGDYRKFVPTLRYNRIVFELSLGRSARQTRDVAAGTRGSDVCPSGAGRPSATAL